MALPVRLNFERNHETLFDLVEDINVHAKIMSEAV